MVHHGFRIEDVAYAMSRFCPTGGGEAAAIFLEAFDLTALERGALPHFTVAVQARTAARYRVREREGTDMREALRTHVRRMRALAADGGLDLGS